MEIENMINLTNVLKKPLLTAGLISAVIISGTANANLLSDAKVYVGAGVDYNHFNVTEYKIQNENLDFKRKNNGMGFAPVVGVKFNENFGIEAGYGFNKKISTTLENNRSKIDFSSKTNNAYLDFMGYMPVMEDKLDLIAGIGLGKLMSDKITVSNHNKATNRTTVTERDLSNKINFRAKLGAQYNVNQNLGIRLLAAYQNVNSKIKDIRDITLDKKDLTWVNSIQSIGLSAVYTF